MKKEIRSISVYMNILLTILFVIVNFTPITGQDKMRKEIETVVKLKNGKIFIGKLKGETDSTFILIVEEIGEISIEKSKILSMDNVIIRSTNYDNKGIPVDYHNSSRYLISPSGYGLKKGQSYYENIYLAFNSFSYGVSDRFTISLGGEFLTLLLGSKAPVFYVSPRLNYELGDGNGAFSVGAIYFSIPDDNQVAGVGLAQAALTLGSRNSNISVGFGAGFNSNHGFNENLFVYSLGITQRLSRKLSLVTDNMIVRGEVENFEVFSLSLRIHFNKPGSALNVGLWRPLEGLGRVLAIPVISATIPIS